MRAEKNIRIGNRNFCTTGKTYVMGILNVTPDSFSDGGKWNGPDKALYHAEEMQKQGADILDIGGESTRPGHTVISCEEEIERVAGVIERIKARLDIPLSIDTYKAPVAKAALDAGADFVNDIWGLKADSAMAPLIAQAGIPCCLMHNRREAVYDNYLRDVSADLRESLELAKKAGIAEDKIVLDPGIGFAKSREQNLILMNHLEQLLELGCPLLLGCSRKSVIGLTLDLPVEEREEGTLVTTVLAVMKGCMFVRVHDVQKNVRAVRMTEAILKA